MGILKNWERQKDYLRSGQVWLGWTAVIRPFAFVIVFGGVLLLGVYVVGLVSRIVEGEIVSMGGFVAVIAVASTAGLIAMFGVEAKCVRPLYWNIDHSQRAPEER